jgi:hypothetical protein
MNNTSDDPGAGFIVELVDTADMPDGQALPPYLDDNVVWHVARRLPGARTRWRRIRLSSETSKYAAVDRRPAARDLISRRRHTNL